LRDATAFSGIAFRREPIARYGISKPKNQFFTFYRSALLLSLPCLISGNIGRVQVPSLTPLITGMLTTQPAVLALDQGTTSSRAMVFDARGHLVSLAQREFCQHFLQPGWVEHDAEEIWRTQRAVAVEATEAALAAGYEVKALGITNQRETTVLWDRATGKPVAPAIVWQDRRTAPLCDAMRRDTPTRVADVRTRTGLVLDAYFSATKLKWLLDHIPDARERATAGELCFGTIDCWLIHKLTGGKHHATDVTNASRTLLCNLHSLQWDPVLLDAFDIPPTVLPRIVPSCGVVGEVTAVTELAGIPIAGVAGDQQSALFGQRAVRAGMAKNTYGTGCFMLMHTGVTPAVSQNGLLTTVACTRRDAPTAYALEGSVFVAGAAIQWLRDGLGIIERAAEVEPLASSVADTGDVMFVPAFAGLGTPHWDSSARGTLVGLTRGTTRAHIARAALEAIAFQSADVFDAMHRDTGIALSLLRVDGGSSANALLMQLQADLAGVPVVRPKIHETTALGAALLAGRAVGVWQDDEALDRAWEADAAWEPQISRDEALARRARWHEAVSRARGWVTNRPK
jgi:glycerol kinase